MSSRADTPANAPSSHTTKSFDGTVIHFDLYDAPSDRTVLVVPGFWRDRRHASMVAICTWIQSLGYRTAVLDVRGHGESEGTYGFNLHEHHDAAAVASSLAEAHGGDVTLVGFSYGGAISVATAARHDLPVRSLVLISPVAASAMIRPRLNIFTMHRHLAFRQVFRRPRAAWRQRRAARTEALQEMGSVHRPVCFVHVKDDWLVGHDHSRALFERANEPKELHILEIAGSYHADRIFTIAEQQVKAIVAQFLERY